MIPKRPNENFTVLAKHMTKVVTNAQGVTRPVLKWFTELQWMYMARQEQYLPEGTRVINAGWVKVNEKSYFEPPEPPGEVQKAQEKETKTIKKYEVMISEFSQGATKRYTVTDMKDFAKEMGFDIPGIHGMSKSDIAKAIHEKMQ